MADGLNPSIRATLLARLSRLQETIASSGDDPRHHELLHEVEGALERLDGGTFGMCQECHEPIEADRLLADPLLCFCLGHLTPRERELLESDLQLTARIQRHFLPEKRMRTAAWDVAYQYQGAGPVSGDYCDLLRHGDSLFFAVGDVSGKGVAAAMLSASLKAMFHSLVSLNLPPGEIMERANRLFCESTLPTHFATMVFGRADDSGEVELCSAGHPPAVAAVGPEVRRFESTGLPLGMFCNERYSTRKASLGPGDHVVLYTDGLVESADVSGSVYGIDRLAGLLENYRVGAAEEILRTCLNDFGTFLSSAPRHDDLTLMVLQRLPEGSDRSH